MKIVILGLITVVFTNVAMASPSDKGGKDDMILEQMKDLRHQLQQQQHVIKELKEEQLQLKEEQVRRDEDQQYKMEELKEKQERSVEEVTKIQRTRRSENETVEHLKELVLAEIKPMIEGLSECEVGGGYVGPSPGKLWYDKEVTETRKFSRNFTRTPKVIAAFSAFRREGSDLGGDNVLAVYVNSITKTKFDVRVEAWRAHFNWIHYKYVACT